MSFPDRMNYTKLGVRLALMVSRVQATFKKSTVSCFIKTITAANRTFVLATHLSCQAHRF
jgi:hypothetical protein